MRVMQRASAVLLATILTVLAPMIGRGGSPVTILGPFDIDPETANANTDFELKASGDGCTEEVVPLSSSGSGPEAALLSIIIPTSVHVQVVGPRPSDEVQATEDYPAATDGTWGSPPDGPIPLNLPEGEYLVTAQCQFAVNGFASSTGSAPPFILLGGNGETAQCTPEDEDPTCYEPQELLVEGPEAGPAEAEEEEPTFTG